MQPDPAALTPPVTDEVLARRLDALERNLLSVEDPRKWRDSFKEVVLEEAVWNSLYKTIGKEARILCGDIATIRKCGDLQGAWQEYERVWEQSQSLFRESLELLGGLAFREQALDKKICRIADALIKSISEITLSNPSLTIPAPQEAFTRTMGRIIRLRFPEWTIWTLPLTAHEYGHVILGDMMPGPTAKLLELFTAEEQPGLELVADALATYIMGPAYASAAIILRLNPASAYREDSKHPAADTRARVILGILRRMNSETSYEDFLERLEEAWETMLKTAQPPGGRRISAGQLDAVLDGIWRHLFISQEIPRNARFPELVDHGGWLRAKKWNLAWTDQLKTQPYRPPTIDDKEIEPGSKLRDVLNAAWLSRIYSPKFVDQIADAALALCNQIIGPTRPGGDRRRHGSPLASRKS